MGGHAYMYDWGLGEVVYHYVCKNSVWGGGGLGQGPLIVGIMQIKNAKYILDTPLPVYVPTQASMHFYTGRLEC